MKYQIEMQPLAGRFVVALKDPGTGDPIKVFTVNVTAAEILCLYRDGADVPEIARILSEKYGVPADRVSADAEAILNSLESF